MTQTLFYIVFFGTILALLGVAFTALPPASEHPLPTEIVDALDLIRGYIQAFDFIIPFDALVDVLTYAITFHIAVWLWKRFWWIIRLLRGTGATGV